MSKFYKPIMLDNLDELRKEILTVFPKEYHSKENFFYIESKNNINTFLNLPGLKKTLDDLKFTSGITRIGFAFTVMPPGISFPIHTDSELFRYSFNIPLTDFEEGYLNFYKTTSAKINITQKNPKEKSSLNYHMFNRDNCELLESNNITTPYIMDTTVPHNVVNSSSTERIMLLVRLEPQVDHIVQQMTGLTDN